MSNGFDSRHFEEAGPTPGMDYLRLFSIIRDRKRLIILGMATCLGAGMLYFVFRPMRFSSDAQLWVVKKWAEPMPGVRARLTYFEDYLSEHGSLIKSPLIVGQAVTQRKLDSLPSLAGCPKPTELISERLNVTRLGESKVGGREPRSAILRLTYTGSVPQDCQTILDAVIASYKNFLEQNNRESLEEVRALFVQWRDEVQKEIDHKQRAYRRLRKNTPPPLWVGSDGFNLSEKSVAEIASARLSPLLRKTEIKEQLAALESAKRSGVSRQVLLDLVSRWSDKTGSAEMLRDQLLKHLLEEQTLTTQFGPRHPHVIAIRNRIELTRQMFTGPAANDDPRSVDSVESYIESLQRELAVTEGLEESLAEFLAEEHIKAKRASDYNEDMEVLRSDLTNLQTLFTEIIKQMQAIDVVKDSEVYHAQVISRPKVGEKTAPMALLVFPIALLVGIAFGGGLACLAEITDQSFRTPSDIYHHLGLPVVGYLPHAGHHERGAAAEDLPNGDRLAPRIRSFPELGSTEAETYRAVRAAIFHRNREKSSKVIQFTSPRNGEGKTRFATNVATAIAGSRKRTVLVDADFRNPCVHQLFDVTAEIGLSSLLAEECELRDALQPSSIAGLTILPCGPSSFSPGELLASPRLKEVLDELRRRFDYVVIDTSSLLAATDPSMVATAVDAVLLVIRNSKDVRPQAERALHLLRAQETKVFGIAVSKANGRDRRNGRRAHHDARASSASDNGNGYWHEPASAGSR